MKPDPGLMPFADHLEELRRRILLVLACVVASCIPFFLLIDRILPVLLSPLGKAAKNLVYLRPTEKFEAYLGLSFTLSLIACFPILVTQLARFVWPAIGLPARRMVIPFLIVDFILLAAGIVFAWLVMAPTVVLFFQNFGQADGIKALWGLGEYIKLISGLVLAMTVLFQVPAVLLFAFRLGILSVQTASRFRRHAIIAILIVSAVIAPPEIASQCLTALPLWLLFELSLLLGRIIEKRHRPEKATT